MLLNKEAAQRMCGPPDEQPESVTRSEFTPETEVLPETAEPPKAVSAVTDDWPPGPDELREDPELLEELRDCDPHYLDELIADNPDLARDSEYSAAEEEAW